MDEMTKEELLSAYLDGEVTAEQRAYVEKLIETDAEARAALEELRTLSDALKSLPRMKVGEDLSQRVLRRAERAILERQPDQTQAPAAAAGSGASEQTDSAETVAMKSDDTLVQPSRSAGDFSGTGWGRRLAGPLAAIAAAILIMIYTNNKQEAELAQAPAHREAAPTMAESEESGEAAIDEDSFHADTSVSSAPEAEPDALVFGKTGERGSPSMSSMRSAEREFKKGYAEEPTTAAAPSKKSGLQNELAKSDGVAGQKPGADAPPHLRNPQIAGKGQQPVASQSMERNRQLATEGTVNAQQDRLSQSRGGRDYSRDEQGAGPSMDEAGQLAPQPQIIVNLVVSSDALESKSLDQLLARQNIHFDLSPANNERQEFAAANLADHVPAPEEETLTEQATALPAAELADNKPAKQTKPAQEGGVPAENGVRRKLDEKSLVAGLQGADKLQGKKTSEKSGREKSDRDIDESVELVYVVATAAQVQAALQELQQQSKDYLAYSIEPQQTMPGDDLLPAGEDLDAVQTESVAGETRFAQPQKSASNQKDAPRQQLGRSIPKEAPVPGSAPADDPVLPPEPRSAAEHAKSGPQTTPAPAPPHSQSDQSQSDPSQAAPPVDRGKLADTENLRRQDQTFSEQDEDARRLPVPEGRAQRVQIPAGELSRWRENSGWYFEPDNSYRSESQTLDQKLAKRNDQPRGVEGGQAANTAPSSKFGNNLLPSDAPSAVPGGGGGGKAPAAENKEAERKNKEASKQPRAPVSGAAPAAAEPVLAPATTAEPKPSSPLVQKQIAQQGEKADSSLDESEMKQQSGAQVASGRQEELVRVLFVVRGARLDRAGAVKGQAGAVQGQTGAEAPNAAAGTQTLEKAESPPTGNQAPRPSAPQPNSSPPEE